MDSTITSAAIVCRSMSHSFMPSICNTHTRWAFRTMRWRWCSFGLEPRGTNRGAPDGLLFQEPPMRGGRQHGRQGQCGRDGTEEDASGRSDLLHCLLSSKLRGCCPDWEEGGCFAQRWIIPRENGSRSNPRPTPGNLPAIVVAESTRKSARGKPSGCYDWTSQVWVLVDSGFTWCFDG